MRCKSLILVIALLGWGCASPEKAALRDFQEEHPSYVIKEVFVGEGDGAVAYVHIRYGQPGEVWANETVWQYIRDKKTGNWIHGSVIVFRLSAPSHSLVWP